MPTSLESGADARALTALTRRWHPVAYSTEISQQPYGTTLLGEPVVVWRDATGRPHAMRDLCIHRGTALSLGRVASNEIICAYHAPGEPQSPDLALRTTCLNTRTGRRLGGGIGSKPSFSAISRLISELFRVFQSMFRTSRVFADIVIA